MRLNPFHGWLTDQLLGQALYVQERCEEPADQLALARKANRDFIGNMWWRVAVHGRLGDAEAAAEALAELQARVPGVAIAKRFIKLQDPQADARFVEGLRNAGMPEG